MRVVVYAAVRPDEVHVNQAFAATLYEGSERLPMIFMGPSEREAQDAAQGWWDEEVAKERRRRENAERTRASQKRSAREDDDGDEPEAKKPVAGAAKRVPRGSSRGAKV